jgi:hypothetical protein
LLLGETRDRGVQLAPITTDGTFAAYMRVKGARVGHGAMVALRSARDVRGESILRQPITWSSFE